MLLFCDGMPRSASTWVYNVAFALLKNVVADGQICRTHNEDSRAALETLGNAADWRIVKCHKLDDHARDIFRAGNARAIYSYRDVFDAIASFLVMFRFSFDDCLQVMEESLDVYDFHRETGYFLALDYESIVNSPRLTVDKIARSLNLQVASSAIAAIDEHHSLTTIKELSGKLATSLGEDRLVKNSSAPTIRRHNGTSGTSGMAVSDTDAAICFLTKSSNWKTGFGIERPDRKISCPWLWLRHDKTG